jgi:ankyrin repeat protein
VKQVLDDLPPTLDDTYTRMLTRINKHHYREALTLLRWLAYARSPPTLGELVDAAITDPSQEDSIDTDERGDLRDVLNILSGLAMIEESKGIAVETQLNTRSPVNNNLTPGLGQDSTMFHSQHLTMDTRVRLAHFSVKEYLESERILGTKADHFHLEIATGHQTLAQSCLTYLRYYSVSNDKTSTKQDLERFPMLKYAAESWFYHSALQHDVEDGREASLLLLEKARFDWLLIYNPDRLWEDPFQEKEEMHSGSAVYYASLLGLPVVVNSLLESGADTSTQGGEYGNALQAASEGGHREIVQLLVDRGADGNAQGGRYSNALQAASEGGHREIVQLLVNRGADVNAQGGRFGNALQAASEGGHMEIVQLLVDRGADVNAQGGCFGNALQAASLRGYTEIVQLLQSFGALKHR